jgi:hypothetical protein
MPEGAWPTTYYEFAFMPHKEEKLEELVSTAEPEDWDYKRTPSEHTHPILFNYIQYTYRRLAEENKIAVSVNNEWACFNSGLVTTNQEPIFLLFQENKFDDKQQPWHFNRFCRRGEYQLTKFATLPDMAHYFEDPSVLVFDSRKDFRANIEHIIVENKDRFPPPYDKMDSYAMQTFLKGAIDNAKERVRRNYKTAIPQYYHGSIQLLLPLCISKPDTADLALVVENHGAFYRASTCLTLDMAYNNARQLARPDRDWLLP